MADWDVVLISGGAAGIGQAIAAAFLDAGEVLHGYPLRSGYAASKWAQVILTKTRAMELGPHGIRVNAISPGSVEGAGIGTGDCHRRIYRRPVELAGQVAGRGAHACSMV